MTAPTDTPRTVQMMIDIPPDPLVALIEACKFAKQLERELAAATSPVGDSEVEKMNAALLSTWHLTMDDRRNIASLLSRLSREREQLREELAKCGKENCFGQRQDGVRAWVNEEMFLATKQRASAAEA